MNLAKKRHFKAPFKVKKGDLNDKQSSFDMTSLINGKKTEKDIKDQEVSNEHDSSGEESSFLKEEILLSDIESLENLDAPIYQKLIINNQKALEAALISITIPEKRFIENQVVTSKTPIEIDDIHDDIARELVFYKQGLDAAVRGRQAILNEGGVFSRPSDYFAEMLKSDEQMEKIKDKLIEKEVEKKASESSKRQRELKKIGKMVQVAKIQQRQQEKRKTLDKIKNLKRKRKGNEELTIEDDFDLALEKANSPHPKRHKISKRQKKNEKYGFGGKKKYKKSNDAKSTNDMFEFSVEKMKQPFKNKSTLKRNKKRNHR